MSKLEFTSEEFWLGLCKSDELTVSQANAVARFANRRLEEMLRDATVVYGNPDVPNSWGLSRTGWCDKPMTHTARLVCVERIDGK